MTITDKMKQEGKETIRLVSEFESACKQLAWGEKFFDKKTMLRDIEETRNALIAHCTRLSMS